MAAVPSTPRTISLTSVAMERSVSTSSPMMFTETPVPVSMEMSIVLVCRLRSRPNASACAVMSWPISTFERPASLSTMM